MIESMVRRFLIPCLLFLPAFVTAQAIDSGSFYLHKFAQNIGKETYRVTKTGNEIIYDVDFKFTDRGTPVPLQTRLVLSSKGEPISLVTKGNTSRFSTINDSIIIDPKQVLLKITDTTYREARKSQSFPVAGYSPGTVQMALLQYWKKHGEPASIPMLPSGAVRISRQGMDTLDTDKGKVVLECFIASGLVWGNEILWTDQQGNLVCLITNDAEGDKLEMMRTDMEGQLPTLLVKAAQIGMKLFTSSMKTNSSVSPKIYISGASIVDVVGSTIINNYDILIEDGLIKQVDLPGNMKIPAGAILIDAKGKTILPGLWDMHAHFQQAEWGPAYLASGVTTVRDCGNEFEYLNAVKAAIDSRQGIGPHIIKAGIIDGPGAMGLGIVRASTPEEAALVVKRYKDNGYQQIKIYSSVKPPIVKAICDEARKLGLTVTGHIPQGMTTKAGIDSGMNMINHMQYVYAMMKKNKDGSIDLDDSLSKAALQLLHDKQIVVDPTIGVFEMIFRSVKDNILDMEPNFYTLPVPLQSLFVNMGMPPEDATRLKPRFEAMLKLVKVLYDAGIPVVAGTDMGFPGYSLARELELYVMAGLTPMEAIQSATIVPAQMMNLFKQTGQVRSGRIADLVILDADPLKDIRNVRKVWKVIKDGQLYEPNDLKRMSGFSVKKN